MSDSPGSGGLARCPSTQKPIAAAELPGLLVACGKQRREVYEVKYGPKLSAADLRWTSAKLDVEHAVELAAHGNPKRRAELDAQAQKLCVRPL